MIPLYGRGGNDTDPRDKVPPRPRGQRTEMPQASFQYCHFFDNHMKKMHARGLWLYSEYCYLVVSQIFGDLGLIDLSNYLRDPESTICRTV